jgi:hypothetical protein
LGGSGVFRWELEAEQHLAVSARLPARHVPQHMTERPTPEDSCRNRAKFESDNFTLKSRAENFDGSMVGF